MPKTADMGRGHITEKNFHITVIANAKSLAKCNKPHTGATKFGVIK